MGILTTNSGAILSPYGNLIAYNRRLPPEYQECEWIGATGTQYIDTGISNITGFNLRAIFSAEFVSASGSDFFFGVDDRPLGTNQYFFAEHIQGFENARVFGNTGTYPNSFSLNTEVIYNAEINFNYIGTMYLFKRNRLNENNPSKGKICYGRISNKEFIPCYRIADSEIGLYCITDNTFHTNAGSGTFTKGADVN